jgi:hypothetical protein
MAENKRRTWPVRRMQMGACESVRSLYVELRHRGILRGISEGEVMAMMKQLTWLALVACAIGSTVAVQVATATHPRPKSASPVTVSLVPAYEQCTAPNRTHGPPLAFPSCNPPSEASDYVTVGTPDANGAPPNFAGFLKLRTLVGAPGPPDDSDVIFAASLTDVRCKAGTSACGNSNAAGGPDYTGELRANATIRITDHWNATSAGGGSDPATVVDIPMPINLTCVSTADTSMGASCDISGNTCLGCLEPVIRDGKRTVVEIGQVRVTDGGADGVVASAPNTLFAIQGIFVP